MIKSIRNLSLVACMIWSACNNQSADEGHTTALLDTVSLSNRSIALAYQDGDKIVATSIDTLKQISFGGATDPAISPDGNKFAYTVSDSLGHKSVWVADMENKMQGKLNLNSTDYYGASWSPDGQMIAVNLLYKDHIWKVALAKADQTGYLIIDSLSAKSFSSPTWKSASEVIVHDLKTLYVFNTSGKQVDRHTISELIGNNLQVSTNSRFFYTDHGQKLVFNATDAAHSAAGQKPLASVFVLDLGTKTVNKITPNAFNVSYLFVTADDRIFFSASQNGTDQNKIYISDLKGNIKPLVDKGVNPTATLK